MKTYKTREFARRARKERVTDDDLSNAVHRAEKGLVDASIGAHLIKQRVGRKGDYRTIIVFKEAERALFLHLFPKSRKATLSPIEELAFRDAAKQLVNLSDDQVEALLNIGEWIEIDYEEPEEDLPD